MLTDATAPRWIGLWFRGAAIYGTLALLMSAMSPPPADHAAWLSHYGFIFTALAFQIVFWIIGGDPVRYRMIMLAGVPEKLAFGVPALLFTARGYVPPITHVFGMIDLILGAGFLLAWRATPKR